MRKFIDPRYLKWHSLEDGPLPLRRVVTGPIFDNMVVDEKTVLMVVGTEEAEKEIWLLRVTEYQGKVYILPTAPPDSKTKTFTAWMFRRKL